MRHRYVFSGTLDDHKLSTFRLISNLKYSGGSCIRVNISDDVQLNKYPDDSYSTTNDERTIDELGYDCYIVFNRKWRKFNFLKHFEPYLWFRVLENIFGLDQAGSQIGWTDDQNIYNEWFNRKGWEDDELNDYGGKKYPHLREDKKGLTLNVNLNPDISFLRQGSGEDDWIKVYDTLKEEINKGKEIYITE